MTQPEDGGSAEPAGSGTPASVAENTGSAPWTPLRERSFRWLWLGVFIGYIGAWMQTVGAQWLLVDSPNAPTLVSLVQARFLLPSCSDGCGTGFPPAGC